MTFLAAVVLATSLLDADPDSVREAVVSADALTRTTAARVALVRSLPFMEELSAALSRETDATAAREQIRALAVLGADPALLLTQAKRFPPSIDADLALAVARRDPNAALGFFVRHRGELRVRPSWNTFFALALWNRPEAVPVAASRILGTGDVAGWGAVTVGARQSNIALPPAIVTVALHSESEEIRNITAWYVVRGYAPDPARIPEVLRATFIDESPVSSDREAFGRELVRRMLGQSRREDPRWLAWLDTEEADALLADDNDVASYLSDAEFTVREKHCRVVPMECVVPRRGNSRSKPVAQPEFQLPTDLPAGMAEAIVTGARCRGRWAAVGSATVDRSGRVQTFVINDPQPSACVNAYRTIGRLSLATPSTALTPLSTENLLLVNLASPSCFDEAPPSQRLRSGVVRPGGGIRAPVIKRRVEPEFPASARASMPPGASRLVIMEAVISRTGCVRSVRLLSQSDYPEINRAAVVAIAQWQFAPAVQDGEPVDVIFNLTMNFKLMH